jgi:hypothetical protein
MLGATAFCSICLFSMDLDSSYLYEDEKNTKYPKFDFLLHFGQSEGSNKITLSNTT